MRSPITRQGSVTVIAIDQPLRQDTVDALSNKLDESKSQGIPQVVIDLSLTPLIDGAGLQWMEDLDMQCADLGGCVRLCGANELCVDILRMTGVGDRLEQFSSLNAAMASFIR